MSRPEAEPLLTPAEVAQIFRVHSKTITRWAKAGKITSIRTLGGHRRYREAEVRALLAGIPANGHCPQCRYLLSSHNHQRACGSAS